jgi:diguanylate cyclase
MKSVAQTESSETFEHAVACAEKAMDLLVSRKITPVPNHYAVSYEYWAGNNSDLTSCLDDILKSGKDIDAYLLRDLYDRFINHEHRRYNAMGNSLQGMLLDLLQTIHASGDDAETYRQTLLRNIEQLHAPNDEAALRAVAQELLDSTIAAKSKSEDLQKRLEATRSEVEQLRVEIEQHRREALIDPLTGLFNRRAMEQLLGEQLATSEDAISMLVLDIDHFKRVNDTYGHAVGDVVLRHIADAIRKSIRGEDIAVRYGGEEFVILLPRTTLQGAMTVAESLRHRVEEMRLVRRQDNLRLEPITISIGVALRRQPDDQESFFHRADKALYVSKSLGRNRVSAESPSN